MRRPLLAVALTLLPALALALLGLGRGWWRTNHPDPARFPVWGVDVSRHQWAIDWPAVARDPRLQFAWVKATEGGDWVDPRFHENWRGARAAGLRVGAYHFFTFCRPGREQAAHFLAVAPAEPDALPPVVDLEFGGNCAGDASRARVLPELRAWLEHVEDARGVRPVIYVTREARRAFLDGSGLDHPLWLRDVWREPVRAGPEKWSVWQFTGRGRVDGIAGHVDLNVLAGETSLASLAPTHTR